MGIICFQKKISKKIKQVLFSYNYSKIKDISQIIVFIFIQKGFIYNIIDFQISTINEIECYGDDNPVDQKGKKRKNDDNPGDEKPKKRKIIENFGIRTTNLDEIEPVKKDVDGYSEFHTIYLKNIVDDQVKDQKLIKESPTISQANKSDCQEAIKNRDLMVKEITTQTEVEIEEINSCYKENKTCLTEDFQETSKQIEENNKSHLKRALD